MTGNLSDLSTMEIYEIAWLIQNTWILKSKNGVNFAAKPYIEAMKTMRTVKDKYGCDDGKSIIIYALGNMSSFRGPTAKLIKDELKRRIK